MMPGALYIVATPIGNLGDMTQRAIETLAGVAVIAAEDTRHSAVLLRHYDIDTPCISLHEHNERQMTERLMQRLLQGDAIALISDAGTPLVSDPGYHLVRAAHERGIRVIPIPGASAMMAAISASGLPTDRFVFEGFLSAKSSARRQRLEALKAETRTLVFFESPHRILATLEEMREIFGREREVVIARELTKLFETVHGDTLDQLISWMCADPKRLSGEFVVLVRGAEPTHTEEIISAEGERVMSILVAELPLKQAASLAAKITGEKRNRLYDYAVRELSGKE